MSAIALRLVLLLSSTAAYPLLHTATAANTATTIVPPTPVFWHEDLRSDKGSVIRIILGDHNAAPLAETITLEWMWKQDAPTCEWVMPRVVDMWNCSPNEIDLEQDSPRVVRCDLLNGARYVGMRVATDKGGFARPIGFRINGQRVVGTVVHNTGIRKSFIPILPTAQPSLLVPVPPTASPVESSSSPQRQNGFVMPSFSVSPTLPPSQPSSTSEDTVSVSSQQMTQEPFPSQGSVTPFKVKLIFGEGLTASQKTIFDRAARRWEAVIVERLPVRVNADYDVKIIASAQEIDGHFSILGRAGPTSLRTREEYFLPSTAIMDFDVTDLERLETEFSLQAVIEHEMAHCLGFGTLWDIRGLLRNGGSSDPEFLGESARKEYMDLIEYNGTLADAPFVPVENMGGGGTQDAHWREVKFDNELMTGYIETDSQTTSPLSRLTVAAMEDLGYVVDYSAAEDYFKPEDGHAENNVSILSTRPHDHMNFFCRECKFTRPLRTVISAAL